MPWPGPQAPHPPHSPVARTPWGTHTSHRSLGAAGHQCLETTSHAGRRGVLGCCLLCLIPNTLQNRRN